MTENTSMRRKIVDLNRIDWGDLMYFLMTAQHKSFRSAANNLHISASTLLRRIENLERQLEGPLFIRLPEGAQLTAFGLKVFEAVSPMYSSLHGLKSVLEREKLKRTSVSIASTEGLGFQWIIPTLPMLMKKLADLSVEYYMSMNVYDVLRHQTDVAVQVLRPTSQEVIAKKIGRMHFCLHASPEYIARHGEPTSADQLEKHFFVDQIDPHKPNGHLNIVKPPGVVFGPNVITTSGSVSAIVAIESGAGLGVLPTYSYPFGRHVVPVLPELSGSSDIWCTYRPEFKARKHSAAVLRWIEGQFSGQTYPWFRDEFIDPKGFEKLDFRKIVDTA